MIGRIFEFSGFRGRWRRVRDDGYRDAQTAIPAAAVIVTAAAMFAAVFALRLQSDSLSAGSALFYTLPIALLALRFGLRGGLAAAIIAELLFVVWATTADQPPAPLAYISRAIAFTTLGVLVGFLSQQLANSERRFAVALSNAPVIVFSLDRDLRYRWVHHSWDGRIEVPMIGRTDLELLPAGEADAVYELKRRVLESGRPESQEVALHDPAGRERWFRTRVEPLRDRRGRVVGVTGASFDVTEIRQALNEAEQSEQHFRTAIESMLEPLAIYSAVRDQAGAIVDFRCDFINSIGAETVGMKPEAMRGELLSGLFPGRLEFGLIDRYAAVVESGEPHISDEVDYVNVFGEREMVRAFDIVVAKFGDGVQVIWRDITERKRAESERDRMASIVDASIDAVMSADLDGSIKTWSAGAERLYGWTAEEMVGLTSLQVLVPPEQHAVRASTFARVAAGESVGPVLASELRKDGSKIRVAFTATPIAGPGGEIVGVARIVRPVDGHPEYFTIDEDEAAAGGLATS